MECPTCKTHNPEGAKFCFNCGTTLAIELSQLWNQAPGKRQVLLQLRDAGCQRPRLITPKPPSKRRVLSIPYRQERAGQRSAFGARRSLHCRRGSRYIPCSPPAIYPQRTA